MAGPAVVSVVIVVAAQLLLAAFSGPFGATALVLSGAYLWLPASLLLWIASRSRLGTRADRQSLLAMMACWALAVVIGSALILATNLLMGVAEAPAGALWGWGTLQAPFALLGAAVGVLGLIITSRRHTRQRRDARS